MSVGSLFIRKLFGTSILFSAGLFSSLAFSFENHHVYQPYDTSLEKEISSGKLVGAEDVYDTHAFKGIPYAEAPVGDLRWRAPQDLAPWEGVRDATEFGNICAQRGTYWGTDNPALFGSALGSEDCLYLNVWRPSNANENLPVMLWIHGGSNARGSASFDAYHGARLASKANAVIVSINFRLGAFGWMYNSFADNGDLEDASGNYALLDMIQSLEWVQENIRTFGGNPNAITIAGNSSGCASVWGLMHSPLAEDLFHRAICSGGGAGGMPLAAGQQLSDSFIDQLLVGFGLASDLTAAAEFRLAQSGEWLAAFMRSVPMEVFASGVARAPSNYIDGYVIPDIGHHTVRDGAFAKVPMIIGTTKNETSMIVGALAGFFNAKLGASDPLLWEQLNADPSTLSVTDIVDPGLYPFYGPVEEVFSYAWNLDADNVTSLVRNHHPDVYRYDFDWDRVPEPWDEVYGATHTLDLPFLFGNFVTEKDNMHKFAWTDENQMSRTVLSYQFMSYISSFLWTGNPNAYSWNPHWHRWKGQDNSAANTRISLDDPLAGSNYRYSFEEYEMMLNQLDPTSRFFADQFVQGLLLELED